MRFAFDVIELQTGAWQITLDPPPQTPFDFARRTAYTPRHCRERGQGYGSCARPTRGLPVQQTQRQASCTP